MITGVHIEVVHNDTQETYAFLRDKLGLPNYDIGGGFLIFELPHVELARGMNTDIPFGLSFSCDDLEKTIAQIESRGVACSKPIREEIWGRFVEFTMPNGRAVRLYEPKYAKGKPVA